MLKLHFKLAILAVKKNISAKRKLANFEMENQ